MKIPSRREKFENNIRIIRVLELSNFIELKRRSDSKGKDSFLRHFENGFFWKKIRSILADRTNRVIRIVGRFVSIASKSIERVERKKEKKKKGSKF